MLRRIHRIIDVNINRVCEGLRVLEDISRFIIEDARYSQQLKSIRHFFSKLAGATNLPLIASRAADEDIGAEHDLTISHNDLASVIHANAKRVQEGIRVLEEMAKLPDIKGITAFSELRRQRYALYTLEKQLITSLRMQHNQDTSVISKNVKADKKHR